MPLAQTLLRPYRDNRQLPQVGALTVANLITDVTRLAGVQGDGAAYPDSSVGVWPAATNLEPYGRGITNKQSNGTGLALAATTENPLFGDGHIRATATGNSASAAIRHPTADALAVSASTAYTVSAWFKKVSGSFSSTGVFFINWLDAGRAYLSTSTGVSVAGVGADWTRYSTSVTSHASAAYADVYWLSLGASQTVTIDITGMQLETGSIATPYIETDGGTASRSAGRIQGPASVLSATQGWFVARVKTGFAAAGPGYTPRLFSLSDATDDGISLNYTPGTGWVIANDAAGGGAAQSTAIGDASLALGDTRTVLIGWTASGINVSKGAAWGAGASRTEIPTISATTFDIGSSTGALAAREAACAFYWTAAGTGPYTALDPVTIAAWGNNDPLPHMFPPSARLSFLAHFNGDGTQYRWAA